MGRSSTASCKVDNFLSLPKADRRVAIAKDVIAQIRAKKYVGLQGTYVNSAKLDEFLQASNAFVESDKMIKELGKCEVCARGAMFLSRMKKCPEKVSQLSFAEDLDSFAEIEKEYDYEFSASQLDAIESAFEGNEMGELYKNEDVEYIEDCVSFCEEVKDDNDRLLMIMQNIIDHNGTFVPSVKYQIVKK
jgi:hypothetical protein